jgi:Heterokaryon incompatibility protein (HET)
MPLLLGPCWLLLQHRVLKTWASIAFTTIRSFLLRLGDPVSLVMMYLIMKAFGNPRSDRSQGIRKPDFCKLKKGLDRQYICRGCNQTETLFEVQREQERQQHFPPQSRPLCFHLSYEELDLCARKCVTCRVFRQGLLLKQLTTEEASSLKDEASQQPIYVTLFRGQIPGMPVPGMETTLSVNIGLPRGKLESAMVSCMDLNALECLALCENPENPMVHKQAEKWLEDCNTNHTECGNLRWSSRNPTRLVRILSDSEIQLIHSPQGGKPMKYTALSYCWGNWDLLTEDEKRRISGSKTTRNNLKKRRESFDCSELAVTIQDSIALIRRLGIEHIWVDTVCIVQDDGEDWQREAAMMHEVYGNAYFTLCACSNDKATEPLFRKREAWSYATDPCRLSDQWITNFDLPLDEMRARSPLSSRAWTLQEERLSPRILYWSGQRMYWSCSRSQRTEMRPLQTPVPTTLCRPIFYEPTLDWALSSPQGFLISCRKGQSKFLHEDWLDLVESYTRRDMSNKKDRFPALSGIASRYHLAQKGDEYLAGLWRKTFAEDLSWSVVRPRDLEIRENLQDFPPSWSWASLPFRTTASLKHDFSEALNFELLEEIVQREAEDPADTVKRGAAVKCVKVRGRLRPFLSRGSRSQPWSAISKSFDGQEKYSFATNPEQPVHSADLLLGRVLTYEARKQEVLGQLDYRQDADRAEKELLQIHCLEIGESAMLLLEHCGTDSKYRRVGVSHGYREDFFAGVQPTELKLV